ncbi:hypothetical protein [Streptomyces sp. NPDC002044]|uniref:hypothetical protein n=1 Tax=Streptomyces sp. NPDC002044 TaxID=3154662 RepID=UPI003322697A
MNGDNPMNSKPRAFEERLKAELLAIAADRYPAPAPARSRASRLRVPLALGAVAATVAGLVALPVLGERGGSSPAYAVTKDDDGTIWIRVDQRKEALPGLERAIRAMGFGVATVVSKPECSPVDRAGLPGHEIPEEELRRRPLDPPVLPPHQEVRGGPVLLKINAETVPASHTVVIVKPSWHEETRLHEMRLRIFEKSAIPKCIPDFARLSDPADRP